MARECEHLPPMRSFGFGRVRAHRHSAERESSSPLTATMIVGVAFSLFACVPDWAEAKPRDAGPDADSDSAADAETVGGPDVNADGALEPNDAKPDGDETASAPTFEIVATLPVDGGVLEDETQSLRITVSSPIRESTVTSQSVRLTRNGTVIPGTLTVDGRDIVFTPTLPLPLGATFRAELSADIRSSEGESLQAANVEFQTREGSWAVATIGPSSGGVQMAVAPAGHAVLVYTGAMASSVWAARYGPSDGWSQPLALSTMPGRVYSRLAVALNDGGRTILAWNQYDYVWYTAFDRQWSAMETQTSAGSSPSVALTRNASTLAGCPPCELCCPALTRRRHSAQALASMYADA